MKKERKKHYLIVIQTHNGNIINVNYYSNEESLIKRFAELAKWHEFDHMAIFAKGKDKPLLTYN